MCVFLEYHVGGAGDQVVVDAVGDLAESAHGTGAVDHRITVAASIRHRSSRP